MIFAVGIVALIVGLGIGWYLGYSKALFKMYQVLGDTWQVHERIKFWYFISPGGRERAYETLKRLLRVAAYMEDDGK